MAFKMRFCRLFGIHSVRKIRFIKKIRVVCLGYFSGRIKLSQKGKAHLLILRTNIQSISIVRSRFARVEKKSRGPEEDTRNLPPMWMMPRKRALH